MASGHQAFMNKIWAAIAIGDISTSFFDPQSNLQQISQLIVQDYSQEEGENVAALLYDANSGTNATLALNQGAYLKGFWMQITLTAPDNGFNFLYLPFVKWETSVKTP